MSENLRVLIVDDDALHLSLVQRLLGSYGIDVQTCDSPLGVSNTVRHSKPDVVLLDVNMAQLSGDRVLGVARRHAPPGTQFVLYSASDETVLRDLAQQVGADGWISKSTEADALVSRIQEYGRRRRAQG
jgi:CheY-like chemotaxis protein